MQQGYIYKITNICNDKIYVGQTLQRPNYRFNGHKYKLKHNCHENKHLQKAWNKYGEKYFKFEIIDSCVAEEIDNKEIYWINKMKTTDRKYGYNIESGGHVNKILSEETKKKMSTAMLKYYENATTDQDRRTGKYNPNSKSVICVNDNKIFNSISEAGKYYMLDMKKISNCVRGKVFQCKSSDGKTRLQFQYYIEGQEYKLQNRTNGKSKKIICLTTNEIFCSILKASDQYNIPTSNISKSCKGEYKFAGKLSDGTPLKWKYYDQYISNKMIAL